MTVRPPGRQRSDAGRTGSDAGRTGSDAGRTGTVAVTVVVDEAHRQSMESMGTRLRDEGMHVDQVLSTLGLITGRLPQHRLPAVRRIEGIAAVERQHGYRLPPPEAPVQ